MKIKLLTCAIIVTACLAALAKDPVLMKINGKNVTLSEFEYLYNKNGQQQVQKESLDDYVNRFVNYKLKVADAEAARIDTSAAFQAEFNGYKADIVKNYLVDTTVNVRLEHEAYDRMKSNVDVDHIMLPRGRDKAEDDAIVARLDSIKRCAENGEDWGELAKKFSIDPSVKNNNGHYGYIAAGMFPYKWEYAAFSTPVGKISNPVATDFGNHLIRVNARRDDPGQVLVEHILLLFPRGANDSAKAVVKTRIDSIYTALKNGADFEKTARALSQDRGTAKNGGKLPWFGVNRMVPQFEKTAFALNDGEISKPFETAYGYHIVKKLEHKGVPTFDEAKKTIDAMIQQDERSTMARDAKLEQVEKQYKFNYDGAAFRKYLTNELNKHGHYDSTFVASVLAKSKYPIFSYADGKKKVLASVLASKVNPKAQFVSNAAAAGYIDSQVKPYADNEIFQYYIDNLINDNQSYRNLLNEYRDGMLLFEISNRKVWQAASNDTTGLKNYFEANRSKYTWDKPHFRGIIVSAQNDSVANAVKADIAMLGEKNDTLTEALHHKYGQKIRMQRMFFAQGENELVDYVVFHGPAPADKKYPVSFLLPGQGEVYSQPRDVADVKGQVTSDYQDVLENQWEKGLKAKYKVEINKAVLKQVKPL